MFQLPAQSRLITALNPSKDWDWDKETQSRILYKLDEISCILANTHREKGKPRIKPDKKWEPKYVTEAKEQYANELSAKRKLTDEELEAIKKFWKQKNNKANFLEES